MFRLHTHLRNLVITTMLLTFVVIFATQRVPIPVIAQQLVILTPKNSPQTGDPAKIVTFTFDLTNNSGNNRTFNINVDQLPSGGFAATEPSAILVGNLQTQSFNISISIPANAVPGTYPPIRVTAKATTATNLDPLSVQNFVVLTVSGATYTPTYTPTRAAGPTNTPSPICQDGAEDDNTPESAKSIDINTSQQRTICPSGDEDWLTFGGIAGKVYTIEIANMADGLDLSLELFDAELRSIAFNDDFYNRDPNKPNPSDMRPQIPSFMMPASGRYYIRVRDTTAQGAVNYFYTILLSGEATGPTPTTVTDLCLDLFEPDGLPEQARLILSNELQEDRRFCPTGDADWVYFYGKAGKRYFIFTDTRRYKGANLVNKDTQAGADTILLLTDRDGVNPLDSNDDISGGATLDSQIEFMPSVDGFYYVQIKNTGDIGNQFIRYDLTLLLCVPGQSDCGRTSDTPARSAPTGIVPTAVTTAATPFVFPTNTPKPTPTSTPTRSSAAATQRQASLIPNGEFADVAFQTVWQRNDLPIAQHYVNRSWLWGPSGLAIHQEPYLQAMGGTRLVQYFDKARMEINDPNADRSHTWFVTNGLLIRELILGQIQIGTHEFVPHQSADIVLAGDAGDPTAPTYASLKTLIDKHAPDRSGEDTLEMLNHNGEVGPFQGTRYAKTRLTRFIQETGHNIPAVFWEFLNTQGPMYEHDQYIHGLLLDWVSVVGYPISEPYWINVHINEVARTILVQAFERRILTYTPDNPTAWQVEMGNVGQHYYQWRYNEMVP